MIGSFDDFRLQPDGIWCLIGLAAALNPSLTAAADWNRFLLDAMMRSTASRQFAIKRLVCSFYENANRELKIAMHHRGEIIHENIPGQCYYHDLTIYLLTSYAYDRALVFPLTVNLHVRHRPRTLNNALTSSNTCECDNRFWLLSEWVNRCRATCRYLQIPERSTVLQRMLITPGAIMFGRS
jgi:hypothetical protein